MAKKQLTTEQVYQKNKRKAKHFRVLAPITLYIFLILAIVFFALAIKHSLGNIFEILDLLDKEVYSGEELKQNYLLLVEKWGEWEIVGEDSAGFVVRYVNIGNALFSGFMVTYLTLSFVFLVFAILVGKIIFPLLAKHCKDVNDELVNISALKSAAQIDEIVKSKKKDWF